MKTTHNWIILIVTAVMIVLHQAKPVEGVFDYDVVPVTLTDVTSGDQYTVSGSITTACDDCLLTVADIIAYDVDVSGPTPFNFTETNIGQFIIANNVVASPTKISIPFPANSSDALSLNAADNSDPNCTNCSQALDWTTSAPGQTLVLYSFVDGDLDPFIVADFTEPNVKEVLIATRIPEPSSLCLLGLMLAGIGCAVRRAPTT